MKRIIIFLWVFCVVLAGAMLFGSFLCLTTRGAKVIARISFARYAPLRYVTVERLRGNLVKGITLTDVTVTHLKRVPQGSILKIQRIFIHLTSLQFNGLTVIVDNARLQMPESDPVLFFGNLKNGWFDFNIFSSRVDIEEIVTLFPKAEVIKKATGSVKDVDLFVKGPLSRLRVNGQFFVDRISYKRFYGQECPAKVSFDVTDILSAPKVFGQVAFEGGTLSGPRTAAIKILASKILYSGLLNKPQFALKGVSSVSNTKIMITLRGTLEKPDLQLFSDPPLDQGQLLIMLATNQGWKATETALNKGQLSADMAKDFIDYFAFGGMGSKLCEQLGIKDLSVKFDNQSKGVDITKNIFRNIDAVYGIEQTQAKPGAGPDTTQKVGGVINLNEYLCVGVERAFTQSSPQAQQTSNYLPPAPNDQVYLKFKKGF